MNQITTPTSDSPEIATLGQFFDVLQREVQRSSETSSVAVMLVSLQRSDRIAALMIEDYAKDLRNQLRARLEPILRSKDRYIFVSENEIWLILPQLASEALAILAAHRLQGALYEPLKNHTYPIFLNPYIGIACAPQHSNATMALLRAAEAAQKNALAGHFKFLMADSDAAVQTIPDNLPQALGAVLDANELNIEYQPKVDLRTREMVSVEALVRWPKEHPQHVPTTLLIEVAERSGLIEALTMRVLNNALQEIGRWKAAGRDVLVWVNLSARLLSMEQLPKILTRTLAIWDVPASSIGLEITESAFIQDIDHSTSLLFELKQLGFHLSIDDFGTGYSSLTYLRRFPIDELKIDRMFIHGMTSSIQDRQIVQSIIDLAHNFGLPVIAEGVENEETLAALEALGCDQIQGYYFARPMAADKLLTWHADFQR